MMSSNKTDGPFLVTVDRWPQPMDTLVEIEWPGPYSNDARYYMADFHIRFEPSRSFYARHFIAIPRMLLKHALRIAWYDFKCALRGHPPRPIETVADFRDRLDAIAKFQQEDIEKHGTYVRGSASFETFHADFRKGKDADKEN